MRTGSHGGSDNGEDLEGGKGSTEAEPQLSSERSISTNGGEKKPQSWGAYALDQLGTAAVYVGGAYVADQALRATAEYTGINPAVVDLVELAAGSAAVAIAGQMALDGVKAQNARVKAALDTSEFTKRNVAVNEASNVLKAGVAGLAAHVAFNNTLGTSVNVQNTVGIMAAVGAFELPIKSGISYVAQLAQPYLPTALSGLTGLRKPLLINEM